MIVNFARCGAHPEIAAGAMGIIPAIYRRWEHQGCSDYLAGNDTQCARLVMGLVAAASQAELHELLSLKRGSDSARFILERRFGQRWALKATTVNIDATQLPQTQTEVGGDKPAVTPYQLDAEHTAALTLLYDQFVGSQAKEPEPIEGLKNAEEIAASLQ